VSAIRDWQTEVDDANQVSVLREVLHELSNAIADLEDSPYADEELLRGQLHDLELVREYGDRKLDHLLA
jgi:hypothetical protein